MTDDQGDVVEISYVPDDEDPDDEVPEQPKLKKEPQKKKSAAVKKIQKRIKDLEESVESITKEKNEFKDKYLRSLAEVDNFRKRIQKEKEDYRKYVLGEFLLNLLDVYDNFERALKVKTPSETPDASGGNDARSILSGVEMIYKQLTDLFRKNKVEEIDALGKTFDPNIHQALSKEEREGITLPVVLEVYQKGFLYNGKLLRPTLAKVAVPKEPEVETDSPGETGEEDTNVDE